MRIILMDEIELSRESLSNYICGLDPAIYVIGANNILNGLKMINTDHKFDLALITLPSLDGAVPLEEMHDLLPSPPLTILTNARCPHDLLPALCRFRISIVPMSYAGNKLLSVLRLISSGEPYVSPSILSFDGADPSMGLPAQAAPFTPRERQVLTHLGTGLGNKEIARLLSIEEVTVRLHLRGIFRKLDARNRTQAVVHAVERGYLRPLAEAMPVPPPTAANLDAQGVLPL